MMRNNRWKGILGGFMSLALLWALSVTAGAWTYEEAAKPYRGMTISVLDEITPMQEAMQKYVVNFEKETGIKVDYQLLNHFEVISKGQADMLTGRGAYDAVMLHSPQLGLLLKAGVVLPLNDLMKNSKLFNPNLGLDDLIQPAWDSLAKFKGKTYGFLNWNYNSVYWARKDLFGHPEEKAAFKKRYGYDLAPAETFQQVRDIAEFFTRKKGQMLAGKTLASDSYGIVIEGIKGGTTLWDVWYTFVLNWGGDFFDKEGRPTIDRKENVEAVKFWASLWKYAPPGTAEYSLIDVPTLMGNGIAAQSIAWSDFGLGVDQPGKSKYAGQFEYRGIPRNADYSGPRAAGIEPSFIVISTHSKKVEPTFLFLQWLVDKRIQDDFITKTGWGVPVRNSSFDLPVLAKSRLSSMYAAMKETLKYGIAKPKAPKLYEIFDVLSAIIQEIALGKKTAEQGLKEGQQKVLSLCKKCFL